MTAATTTGGSDGSSTWTGLVAPAHLGDDLTALCAALPDGLPPLQPRRDEGIERVAVHDDGDPLVRIDGPAPEAVPCTPAYRRRGLPGTTSGTWVRAGVAERLAQARALLPDGFDLHVLDGWRSVETQRALFDEVYHPGSTAEPGWVADPDDEVVPPPHSTGAAVDLTLAWQGTPLALGTDFDAFEPTAHLAALEGTPGFEPDRALRRLLAHVLTDAGFAGLAEEWWHVSWGDQRWALHHGGTARYGPTAPPAG
jgi:D-alanyl-D-alanine dipeptidase